MPSLTNRETVYVDLLVHTLFHKMTGESQQSLVPVFCFVCVRALKPYR